MVSETQSVNGGLDEELLVEQEPCDAYDLIYFFTNHVFQESDGSLSCDSLNPFFYETTWAFSLDEDSIIVDEGFTIYIDNLTRTNFVCVKWNVILAEILLTATYIPIRSTAL
ncbi:MAG: hypothetical protein ACI8XB_001284 [Patiriisocius sp.]